MQNHETFMNRCLQLAANGLGNVAPNPLVGCVVVHDGKIIGEGFHRQYGGPHAEVNAINNVSDQQLLRASTLYVNLEPCAHHGKTDPCADLIIEKRFKCVVIGSRDTNPLVAGRGIQKLHEAGIELVENVLEDECLRLNRRFYTWHQKQRPYIILKWAKTNDGYIDKIRLNEERAVGWITDDASRRLVHLWRSQEQALLVGSNTVRLDNPSLTVRHVLGNNPLRVVLTNALDVPPDSTVLNNEAKTLLFFHTKQQTEDRKVKLMLLNDSLQFHSIQSSAALYEVMDVLYQLQIQSVMVEGGASILHQFIESDLWDEARVFTGSFNFKNGVRAPELNQNPARHEMINNDSLNFYFNK
ncbi:MAG: bifunctional diaminohydroxyphosphoribosylaminopyrimidine deaminase/5-amino-6-(5-phosphoribosylamino)uracil reductase RibD [Flavobacteriales bacterium]